MNKVASNNRTLIIDRKEFTLDHPIHQVRIIENLAIVIYDFDDSAPKHTQFQNCKAFDDDGKLIWTAEHPTNSAADSYVEFMNETDDKLWNFACFVCELNFKNGRLKNAVFRK